MTDITFTIIDPDAEDGALLSAQDPSPYIRLSDPWASVQMLQGARDIVIPHRQIYVRCSYPLSHPVTKRVRAGKGATGFTRAELAFAIAALYHQLYRQERETSTIPEGTVAADWLNRNTTNGKYGIYLYALADLQLRGLTFRPEKNWYELMIDS
jgi:hypothetical protein